MNNSFTLVSYDVNSKHSELKEALLKLGFEDKFTHEGQTVNLPNTTFRHKRLKASEARAQVENVCSRLNIILQRIIAVEYENWSALYGIPFN